MCRFVTGLGCGNVRGIAMTSSANGSESSSCSPPVAILNGVSSANSGKISPSLSAGVSLGLVDDKFTCVSVGSVVTASVTITELVSLAALMVSAMLVLPATSLTSSAFSASSVRSAF